jgi:mannan endo-1,4-beta-mannosidase
MIPIAPVGEALEVAERHQEYLICSLSGASEDSLRLQITHLRANEVRCPVLIDVPPEWRGHKDLMGFCERLIQDAPDHNLLFLLLPGPGAPELPVLEEAVGRKLPFVAGISPESSANLVAECERLGVGYVAWSWAELSQMGTAETLTDWGREIVDGANGIQNTSQIPGAILEGDYPHESHTPDESVVENGDFEHGTEGWTLRSWQGGAEVEAKNGVVHFAIGDPGIESWSIQFSRHIRLTNRTSYVFSMRAKADSPRTLNVNIKRDSVEYTPYANGRQIDLSTSWQDFSWKFTMKAQDDPSALLTFDMGGNPAGWSVQQVCISHAGVGEKLHAGFYRRVQKNSGYFNAPNNAWELHLYSVDGELLEVLDKGKGGEGMRAYPKLDRSGVIVLKDA